MLITSQSSSCAVDAVVLRSGSYGRVGVETRKLFRCNWLCRWLKSYHRARDQLHRFAQGTGWGLTNPHSPQPWHSSVSFSSTYGATITQGAGVDWRLWNVYYWRTDVIVEKEGKHRVWWFQIKSLLSTLVRMRQCIWTGCGSPFISLWILSRHAVVLYRLACKFVNALHLTS